MGCNAAMPYLLLRLVLLAAPCSPSDRPLSFHSFCCTVCESTRDP